jgi:hypothetical protein
VTSRTAYGCDSANSAGVKWLSHDVWRVRAALPHSRAAEPVIHGMKHGSALPWRVGLRDKRNAIGPGAQTSRPDDAEPVSKLCGGIASLALKQAIFMIGSTQVLFCSRHAKNGVVLRCTFQVNDTGGTSQAATFVVDTWCSKAAG